MTLFRYFSKQKNICLFDANQVGTNLKTIYEMKYLEYEEIKLKVKFVSLNI